MGVTAQLICGWIIDSVTFFAWCEIKNIDIKECCLHSGYKDIIPGFIDIIPIHPYSLAEKEDLLWGIHIRPCDGSFRSIQSLDSFLLYQAGEFVYGITKEVEEPRCHTILNYSN